jgi:hypothetical protein
MGKSVIALVAPLTILNAVLLAVTGFQADVVKGIETLISTLYVVMAGVMLAGLAEELSTGQALAYLIHPITNREYIAAWMLAGPGLLGASYILAILAPIVVIEPSLVFESYVYEPVVYGLIELIYITLIALMASLVLRNRSRVTTLILSFVFLAPIVIMIVLSIISIVLGIEPSLRTLISLIMVFHPMVPMLSDYSDLKVASLLYAITASAILGALLFVKADRLEV